MTYRPVEAIRVHAWGRVVGAIARNPATGQLAFRYDRDWLAGGVELAPLHMPLSDRVYEFPGLSIDTFRGLPPLLADALPDRFGNALVDRWMAEQGVAPGAFTVLDRLAYAADRAMGALEFEPAVGPTSGDRASAVQLADLVLAARSTVAGEPTAVDRGILEQLIAVGTSAGGARAKAVVAYRPGTGQIRSASKDLDEGFEHWLFKLDGVSGVPLDGHTTGLGASGPYGRVEYAYSLMARAAGVEMSPCDLLAEGPRRHFITRRFDRAVDGTKHHVISLCALAHLDFNLIGVHSYDQYLATVTALGLGPDALEQAFRRMVFNVAAANCDDHSKNLAFLRRDGGGWQLAPAFDVTFAHDPASTWTRQHLMSVNGRVLHIGIADLHAVGERHEVPGYRHVVREVLAAVDRWPEFASAAELAADATDHIAAVLHDHRPH